MFNNNNNINNKSKTLSLKFVLIDGVNEPEVRRFDVDQHIGTSLTSLQKMLASVYPNLGLKRYRLTWIDSDGDKVSIGSDVELLTALAEMKGPVFKINVEIKKEASYRFSSDADNQHHAHHGIICDGCDEPVRGIRYKCLTCPDFDLCKNCEERGGNVFHDMVRMAAPSVGQNPGLNNIQNNLERQLRQNMRGSDPCPMLKPRHVHHDQVHEIPFRSLMRQLLGDGKIDRGDLLTAVRPEVVQPSSKKMSTANPREMKLQIVNTPIGKMLYYLPMQDHAKAESSAQVQKQCQCRSKSSTPEPQALSGEQRRLASLRPHSDHVGQNGLSGQAGLAHPDGSKMQLKIVDTPFGKMFHWVQADPVQGDNHHHREEPIQQKVDVRSKSSTPAPETPKGEQNETESDQAAASKEYSPVKKNKVQHRSGLMSVLEKYPSPNNYQVQLFDTPFGMMYYLLEADQEGEVKRGEEVDSRTKQDQREIKSESSKPEQECTVTGNPIQPSEPTECTNQVQDKSGQSLNGLSEPKKSPARDHFQLQLIDTPFGRMFHWIGSGPEEETENKSCPESRPVEIKINHMASESDPMTNPENEKPDTESPESRPVEVHPEVKESDGQDPETFEETGIECVEQACPTTDNVEQKSDSDVEESLQAMLDMGFTNDGGWLTKLLQSKGGNVGKALDALQAPIVSN